VLRVLVALAATAGCTWLRTLLTGVMGDTPALLPFAPAVLVSAWYGGLWPGVLATVLGTLMGDYLWSKPAYTLGVRSASEAISLGLFAATGVLISILNEKLLRARGTAEEAASALAETEEYHRLLLESVRDYGIIRLDTRGRVASWNEGAQRLLGYRAADITGKHFSRFYTDGELQRFVPEQHLEQAGSYGRVECEGWRVSEDRSTFWARVVTCAIRDSHGQLRGFSQVVEDISDHRREQVELLESQRQLRDLAAHLQAVRESERVRISREIHDGLGQSLTCLKMDVSWLQNRLDEEQTPLIEKAQSIREQIDQTVQTMRRIAAELRPRVLDDFGLAAAIEWQAAEFESRSGIRCTIERELPEMDLDRERSTALFRILQEALTNVARHSEASLVTICLEDCDDAAVLHVQDNGKGLPPEHAPGTRSLGLFGMRERAHVFGGRVMIASEPGRGTRVTVHIPKPAEAQ
jgi:PAS domain S-box-containing protein